MDMYEKLKFCETNNNKKPGGRLDVNEELKLL